MSTTPTAQRWATYNGNTTEMVGQTLVGPNTMGEKLTPVIATYDEETNTTRVGFVYGDQRAAMREGATL